MHPESGLSHDAHGLAVYARALDGGAPMLRDRPDLVYQVLEGIEQAIRNLDSVIDEAAHSYLTHAGTAVTDRGDELAGATSAVHIGGYLEASAQTTRSLAALLRRATAAAEQIAWPQHDTLAAERLADLRARLGHRAAHLDPDSGVRLPGQAPGSPEARGR